MLPVRKKIGVGGARRPVGRVGILNMIITHLKFQIHMKTIMPNLKAKAHNKERRRDNYKRLLPNSRMSRMVEKQWELLKVHRTTILI